MKRHYNKKNLRKTVRQRGGMTPSRGRTNVTIIVIGSGCRWCVTGRTHVTGAHTAAGVGIGVCEENGGIFFSKPFMASRLIVVRHVRRGCL